MTATKHYKCVNCGEPASALFKTYGPTVLKLTKCVKCKKIVDKYIEYDPVIVMIDLVLMSKEAQRHVLFNTDFKSYWKLLVILVMLETYGVWRHDSLYTSVVHYLCGQQNSTLNDTLLHTSLLSVPLNISAPEYCKRSCESWLGHERGDDTDLFIWEKDFYIKFISIFAGIAAFILTVQGSMQMFRSISSFKKVNLILLLKSFSLWHMSSMLSLPALVWHSESARASALPHYSLVFAYSFVGFVNVFTVLYECPTPLTTVIMSLSFFTKYCTSFFVTSYLRNFVT